MTSKRRIPKLNRRERLVRGLLNETSPEVIHKRFTVVDTEEKGRGIFLKAKVLKKDSFVLEYEGDIISPAEAKRREAIYSINNEGCFIMNFIFQEKRWCIDATRKFSSLARLLNHSRKPNIRFHSPLVVDLEGNKPPRIAAYALRDIRKGEEILFDYGVNDRRLSWLRTKEGNHVDELPESSTEEEEDEEGDSQGKGSSSPKKSKAEDSFTIFGHQWLSDSYQLENPQRVPASRDFNNCHGEENSNSLISEDLKPILSGEYKIKFTSMGGKHFTKSYLIGHEPIGEPATIMKFKEDLSRQLDVISLSSSDCSANSCRSKKSVISIGDYSEEEMTFEEKVDSWKRQNPVSEDSESFLQISDIRSLQDVSCSGNESPSKLGPQGSPRQDPLPSTSNVRSPSRCPNSPRMQPKVMVHALSPSVLARSNAPWQFQKTRNIQAETSANNARRQLFSDNADTIRPRSKRLQLRGNQAMDTRKGQLNKEVPEPSSTKNSPGERNGFNFSIEQTNGMNQEFNKRLHDKLDPPQVSDRKQYEAVRDESMQQQTVNSVNISSASDSIRQQPIINDSNSIRQQPYVNNSERVRQQPIVNDLKSSIQQPIINCSNSSQQQSIVYDSNVSSQQPIVNDSNCIRQEPILNESSCDRQEPIVNDSSCDKQEPIVTDFNCNSQKPFIIDSNRIRQKAIVNDSDVVIEHVDESSKNHSYRQQPVVNGLITANHHYDKHKPGEHMAATMQPLADNARLQPVQNHISSSCQPKPHKAESQPHDSLKPNENKNFQMQPTTSEEYAEEDLIIIDESQCEQISDHEGALQINNSRLGQEQIRSRRNERSTIEVSFKRPSNVNCSESIDQTNQSHSIVDNYHHKQSQDRAASQIQQPAVKDDTVDQPIVIDVDSPSQTVNCVPSTKVSNSSIPEQYQDAIQHQGTVSIATVHEHGSVTTTTIQQQSTAMIQQGTAMTSTIHQQGKAMIQQQETAMIATVQQEGTVTTTTILQQGTATIQQQGTATIQQQGTATIQQQETTTTQQQRTAMVNINSRQQQSQHISHHQPPVKNHGHKQQFQVKHMQPFFVKDNSEEQPIVIDSEPLGQQYNHHKGMQQIGSGKPMRLSTMDKHSQMQQPVRGGVRQLEPVNHIHSLRHTQGSYPAGSPRCKQAQERPVQHPVAKDNFRQQPVVIDVDAPGQQSYHQKQASQNESVGERQMQPVTRNSYSSQQSHMNDTASSSPQRQCNSAEFQSGHSESLKSLVFKPSFRRSQSSGSFNKSEPQPSGSPGNINRAPLQSQSPQIKRQDHEVMQSQHFTKIQPHHVREPFRSQLQSTPIPFDKSKVASASPKQNSNSCSNKCMNSSPSLKSATQTAPAVQLRGSPASVSSCDRNTLKQEVLIVDSDEEAECTDASSCEQNDSECILITSVQPASGRQPPANNQRMGASKPHAVVKPFAPEPLDSNSNSSVEGENGLSPEDYKKLGEIFLSHIFTPGVTKDVVPEVIDRNDEFFSSLINKGIKPCSIRTAIEKLTKEHKMKMKAKGDRQLRNSEEPSLR